MPVPPLLLGHRGARASRRVPENTISSFALALEHGCDGFEFDVRRTAGGQAVVCHDARARGVTIARADHNHALDLPYLEQVLQHFADGAFLDIELKVPGLESKTLALLREHLPRRGYVVSSFLPGVVAELRASRPDAPLGIICEKPGQLARWRQLPVQYVIVHKSLLTRNLVGDVHIAGRKVFAWTINDQRTMLQLAEWEVDGIISDDTWLLARTLGKIKNRQS